VLHPAAGLFVFFTDSQGACVPPSFHNCFHFGIFNPAYGFNIRPLNISPFILRELKAVLRQERGGYRHVAAYIVIGLTIFFLLIALIFDPRPQKVGAPLFAIIGLLALMEILAIGSSASALFSEERRNKTLGLLFSTGIRPSEVLVGKLSAILITPLSRLLTIVPCLLIISMTKAATLQVCLASFLTLLVLLVLVSSVYLLSSLLFKEHTSGSMASNLFLALLIGFFPLVDFLNRYFGSGRIDRFWMSLNPAAAPWLLYQHPRTNVELGYVYLSIEFSMLFALACFSVAAFLLSRIWQDEVSGTRSLPFATLFHSLHTRQKKIARRLLDSSPYEWLIHRDFQPNLVTWGTFAIAALVWLLGFWHWGATWLIPMNFWITLVLLGLFVRWMTVYLGARQISLDRSNGTLELLLTSPLSVGDIVAAQHAAIQKFVRPLYSVLGFLHLLFFLLGLLFHPMTQGASTNYIIISALIALFGPWFNFQSHWGPFWIGLNTGRPMFALTKYSFGGFNRFSFIWMLFVFRGGRLPNAPTGSFVETVVIGCIVAGLILWYIFYRFCWTTDWNATQKMRNLAILHMRALAAEPVPDVKDPSVAKWDHTTPLFNHSTAEEETDIEAQDERRRQRILQQHHSS
jgi:ABC-type Na+ efflux pump permease subunit